MKPQKRSPSARFSRLKGSLHPSLLPLVGLLAVFAFIMTVSEPLPYQAAPALETPTVRMVDPTQPPMLPTGSGTPPTSSETPQFTPTATPLPAEFLANREQTLGIIVGTVVLVILVVGGSLIGIWTRRRE